MSSQSVKRYSMGLLLAGMGLIVGSCVPLLHTVSADVDPEPTHVLTLSPTGAGAGLTIGQTLRAVPVLAVAPLPGALPGSSAAYTFTLTDSDGVVLLRETGEVRLPAVAEDERGGRVGAAEIPLGEVTLAAGRWTARFGTAAAAPVIDRVELRLMPPTPGLIAGLLTALTLAILGWLAAALGALQWIRAEASRPVPDAEAARDAPERAWIVGCHLSALLGYVLPFGHLIGPSAVWLYKRRQYPAVEHAGRQVLNFQLSVTLYVLAGLFLSFFLIGVVVLFALVVFHFSVVLFASLRAQRAAAVHYPLSIRFI